mmetsp:Transcript_77120/g.160555  ORF Transcript_77120/g.160555 Transcript_77120/m.160555 type:complete len:393 (-) Transcript_77120:219-1397(-)
MEIPQPLQEAGLYFEFLDKGRKLVVRDATPDGCKIRNRGGEALANFLRANRQLRSLDLSQAGIADNGIGHICLALRQTNQLEEFNVSSVGLAGLDFLIGIVRRCDRLKTLSISVVDTCSLEAAFQNVQAEDYDTSGYIKVKKEGEEEEEDEEEEEPPAEDDEDEPEERERKKMEQLRQLLNEHDYNSEDEEEDTAGDAKVPQKAKSKRTKIRKSRQVDEPGRPRTGPSPAFLELLQSLAAAVQEKDNLLEMTCAGADVPDEIMHDITRSIQDHNLALQKRLAAKQERGTRTALDAMKAQMEELTEHGNLVKDPLSMCLPGEENITQGESRLGMRSFVARRLFSALGEALFECQRFKSKENEAVATWQGECAFIAMYLRKLAAQEQDGGDETN